MKNPIPTLVLATLFLAPAMTAQAQISIGIRIGEPPAARAFRVPPRPGPEYVWVEGYQYPDHGHYKWHDGYWTRPPYEGAYWVAPYHVNGRYYAGQWEGGHGIVKHDHRTDKRRDRDHRGR